MAGKERESLPDWRTVWSNDLLFICYIDEIDKFVTRISFTASFDGYNATPGELAKLEEITNWFKKLWERINNSDKCKKKR